MDLQRIAIHNNGLSDLSSSSSRALLLVDMVLIFVTNFDVQRQKTSAKNGRFAGTTPCEIE